MNWSTDPGDGGTDTINPIFYGIIGCVGVIILVVVVVAIVYQCVVLKRAMNQRQDEGEE